MLFNWVQNECNWAQILQLIVQISERNWAQRSLAERDKLSAIYSFNLAEGLKRAQID